MRPKAVSFDCAGTLIDVKWSIGPFAESRLEALNLSTPEGAGGRYGSMFHSRLASYHLANQTRSSEAVRDFWIGLDRDFLTSEGLNSDAAEEMYEAGMAIAFGPDSGLFLPFRDAEACLSRLAENRIPAILLSNWDISLHRVVEMRGWGKRFVKVIASLEEGFEKPDPRLFQIALDALGLEPGEVLHVGDDPVDDYRGAKSVGMRAILVDRSRTESIPPYIKSLDDLEEAFGWNG